MLTVLLMLLVCLFLVSRLLISQAQADDQRRRLNAFLAGASDDDLWP